MIDMEKIEWIGGDFSHWNSESDFLKYVETCEFFAHKATESVSIKDDKFYDRVLRYIDSKPTIAYHVLSASTDISKQATHFIETVNKVIYRSDITKKRIGYMIDVEYDYFKSINEDEILCKILQFGEKIIDRVNHRPIVYLGDLYSNKVYNTLKAHDWLIWIARYSNKNNVKHKDYMDFWQYTSNPYDKDIFYGDVNKLHSFLRGWK